MQKLRPILGILRPILRAKVKTHTLTVKTHILTTETHTLTAETHTLTVKTHTLTVNRSILSLYGTKEDSHAALIPFFLYSFFVRYQDIREEKRDGTCEDHCPEGGGEERDGALRQAATNRGKKGDKGEDGG